MSDTMSAAPETAEPASAIHGKAAFSYCCECGTYGAHTTVCTCCGFDFRDDARQDETEIE